MIDALSKLIHAIPFKGEAHISVWWGNPLFLKGRITKECTNHNCEYVLLHYNKPQVFSMLIGLLYYIIFLQFINDMARIINTIFV